MGKFGKRRRKHKHLLLYKMFNNLSPLYLCSLIPPTVDTQSSYNLRNAHNIRTIHSRTTQYFNSFLPSTIRERNNLPLDVRNCDSIISFKSKLNSDINVVPKLVKYVYAVHRNAWVLHVRIRIKCSSLNNDFYKKKGINTYHIKVLKRKVGKMFQGIRFVPQVYSFIIIFFSIQFS